MPDAIDTIDSSANSTHFVPSHESIAENHRLAAEHGLDVNRLGPEELAFIDVVKPGLFELVLVVMKLPNANQDEWARAFAKDNPDIAHLIELMVHVARRFAALNGQPVLS